MHQRRSQAPSEEGARHASVSVCGCARRSPRVRPWESDGRHKAHQTASRTSSIVSSSLRRADCSSSERRATCAQRRSQAHARTQQLEQLGRTAAVEAKDR
eukprot:808698-Pleurochrysis_carterae.AAC.2